MYWFLLVFLLFAYIPFCILWQIFQRSNEQPKLPPLLVNLPIQVPTCNILSQAMAVYANNNDLSLSSIIDGVGTMHILHLMPHDGALTWHMAWWSESVDETWKVAHVIRRMAYYKNSHWSILSPLYSSTHCVVKFARQWGYPEHHISTWC